MTPILKLAVEKTLPKAVLLYGHDQALQSFRLRLLLYGWSSGQKIEAIHIDTLKGVESYLEAGLFGFSEGRKVFILSNAGDALLSDLQPYLENIEASFLLLSSKLNRKSRLVSYLDASPRGISFPCYEKDVREIKAFVRWYFDLKALSLSSDILDFLTSHGQRHLEEFFSDLAKVELFAREEKTLTVSDLENLLVTEERLSTDQAESDFLSGRYASLESALLSSAKQGVSEIGLLQLLLSSLETLLFFKEKGVTALKSNYASLGRRLPFSKLDLYEAALKRWSKEKILEGISLLRQAEKKLKTFYPPFDGLFPSLMLNAAQLPDK